MVKKNNNLVRLALDEHKWINTPVVYTKYGSTFTSFQQDLMLQVISHLQDHIKSFLDTGCHKHSQRPNPAIPSEAAAQMPPIRIELSKFGVTANHYDRVEEALTAIRDLWCKTPKFDESTGLRTGDLVFPIFKLVEVPLTVLNSNTETESGVPAELKKRRQSYIELTINDVVSSYVFDMSSGYINHLERIAYWCNSAYTSRLYLLLMKYVSRRVFKPVIAFQEIRDFLGMVERNQKTGEVVKERYTKYSEFSKKVLNVVVNDMARLSFENKIEFELDVKAYENGYEPIYPPSRKRGNPDSIRFYIKRSPLGIVREVEMHRSSSEGKLLDYLLKLYPTLNRGIVSRYFSDVRDEMWHDFRNFVYDKLPAIVERPHRWDGTNEEFIMQTMKNFVKSWKNKNENPQSETEDPYAPESDPSQKESVSDLFSSLPESERGDYAQPQPSAATTVRAKESPCPYNEGEFKEEWSRFMSEYDGPMLPLLAKAQHLGSMRGFNYILFEDKSAYDAFEESYNAVGNKEAVKDMTEVLASVMPNPYQAKVIVRGYKKPPTSK